jgi:DNA polymerase family B
MKGSLWQAFVDIAAKVELWREADGLCNKVVSQAAIEDLIDGMSAIMLEFGADTPSTKSAADTRLQVRATVVRIRGIVRELYMTFLVQRARADIDRQKRIVNTLLWHNNGTKFLEMAYEEVLMPVFFTGKKKYFGYAHKDIENWRPARKDLFIKGLDFIKQGQTAVAKDLGYTIIEAILDIDNEEEPMAVIRRLVPEFYTKKWALSDLSMTAKRKIPSPGKPGNAMVNKFVERMIEMKNGDAVGSGALASGEASMFDPPEVGDKFRYVIVRRDTEWNLKGNKVASGKGDKIVYLAAAERWPEKYVLDLPYYMEHGLAVIFARFISYMPEFQPRAEEVIAKWKGEVGRKIDMGVRVSELADALVAALEEDGRADDLYKWRDTISVARATAHILSISNEALAASGLDSTSVRAARAVAGARAKAAAKAGIAAVGALMSDVYGQENASLFQSLAKKDKTIWDVADWRPEQSQAKKLIEQFTANIMADAEERVIEVLGGIRSAWAAYFAAADVRAIKSSGWGLKKNITALLKNGAEAAGIAGRKLAAAVVPLCKLAEKWTMGIEILADSEAGGGFDNVARLLASAEVGPDLTLLRDCIAGYTRCQLTLRARELARDLLEAEASARNNRGEKELDKTDVGLSMETIGRMLTKHRPKIAQRLDV